MNYYVFRIDYEESYQSIVNELFSYNRLRQGWGCEGMDIRGSYETFLDGWIKAWGPADERGVRSKFRNLQIMLDMEPGDIIVIPKVSKTGDNRRTFTVARCKEPVYSFSTLGKDFGHTISVSPFLCCSYDHDDASRIVSAKFKAYQSALNRVYNGDFINAVNQLIEKSEHEHTDMLKEDSSSLGALLAPTSDAREEYLKKIVERINLWNPNQLEKIISELFVKNGFERTSNNQYNRTGGDIDLVFSSFVPNTLMSDVFLRSANKVDMPQIRVQAKKKWGQDSGDQKGVYQLRQMQGDEQAINIVINTTEEFSDETKTLAGKDVILINGIQFAALLVKYGLDIIE